MRTGIDIIQISRLENKQNDRLVKRILTEKEINYLKSKSKDGEYNLRTLAGLYSAKEAVSKALGTGVLSEISFQDIEIDHDDKGRPISILSPKAQKILFACGGSEISVSISHDGDYATSVCVII
ncbi:MAG: holo-ACP synthase [Clostridia bacterium]